MPALRALVANLSGSTERSTIRSSAVTRDMTLSSTKVRIDSKPGHHYTGWPTYQLAARVTFHGLCLAIPSEVVGTAALVAHGRSTKRSRKRWANRSNSSTQTGSHRSIGTNALFHVNKHPNKSRVNRMLRRTYSHVARLVADVAPAACG